MYLKVLRLPCYKQKRCFRYPQRIGEENLPLHAGMQKESKLSISYMARRSAPKEVHDRLLQAIATSLGKVSKATSYLHLVHPERL